MAESLLQALSAEGYTSPTPIQSQVIPTMLSGQDVLGIAQTGTGKTAAFVLPLLQRIAQRETRARPRSCGALILAPTRELAAQIADSIRRYGRLLRPRLAVIVGGAKPGPQIQAVSRGVDIIVATPGRLLDHLSAGVMNLNDTRAVVLDEADQMLDLGFMPAIRRIMGYLPQERQTVLLSATMPKQVRALANDFLHSPAEIAVAPVSRPIERIDQKVMHVDSAAKRSVLVDLLAGEQVERAIVFTRTKRGADRVSQHLERAGLANEAIHGDKSQGQRQRALNAFRAGRVSILVATDIAARGIDVDGVSHVINFELPNVPEAYVHRIGRTARAGRSGFAISLCDPRERPLLRDIEKLIGATLTANKREGGRRDHTPREHHGDGHEDKRQEARARSARQGEANNGQRNGDSVPASASGAPDQDAANQGAPNRRGRGNKAPNVSPKPRRQEQAASRNRRKGGRPGAPAPAHARHSDSRPSQDGLETGLTRMLGVARG